jgi:hypothetical protein
VPAAPALHQHRPPGAQRRRTRAGDDDARRFRGNPLLASHEALRQSDGGPRMPPTPPPARATQTEAADTAKLFITADELLRDSLELGLRIVRSGFRPSFLVGVWRGGAPIGIAVQEVLEYHGIPTDHIAIRTSYYTGIDRTQKAVRVHALDYLVSRLCAEDRLLLIDDIFDSGRSLEAALDELARRCRRNLPAEIRIATVYYKPERNRSRLRPDYFIHETDRWLVFPHELNGLTPREILEHKPVDASFLREPARSHDR